MVNNKSSERYKEAGGAMAPVDGKLVDRINGTDISLYFSSQ
jgi:hypothetical protein